MLTRIAIYEGRVRAGLEDEFFRRVESELEPIWRQFPNVTAVRVLRTGQQDAEGPPIAMVLEMDFPSMAAIAECLNSPIRPKAHAATLEVMKLFDGRFYHVVAETRSLRRADAGAATAMPHGRCAVLVRGAQQRSDPGRPLRAARLDRRPPAGRTLRGPTA